MLEWGELIGSILGLGRHVDVDAAKRDERGFVRLIV